MTNKAGRPKAAPGQARTELLKVRMTPDERRSFERAAEIAGIGVSAWMREKLRRVAARELEQAGELAAFLTKCEEE